MPTACRSARMERRSGSARSHHPTRRRGRSDGLAGPSRAGCSCVAAAHRRGRRRSAGAFRGLRAVRSRRDCQPGHPEGRGRFEQQLREDQRTDLWYVVGQYADEHTGQLVRAASAEQQRHIRDGQPAPNVDVIAWDMAYKAVKDQVTVERLTSNEIAATLEDLRTTSGPSLMPRSSSDTGPTVSPTPAVQGPAHSL